MEVTQNDFDGLGTDKEPHKKANNGSGSDKIEADVIWFITIVI